MRKYSSREVRCFVCGQESVQTILVYADRQGYPDLDARPPEPLRGTYSLWVQECPNCGYVSVSIADPTGIDTFWLHKMRNRFASYGSEYTRRFYQAYAKYSADKDFVNAFRHILYAAWSCDDEKDLAGAERCRRLALGAYDKLPQNIKAGNDGLLVVKTDIMRRAGMFGSCIDEISRSNVQDPFFNHLLQFEREKASKHDSDRYDLSTL